MSMAKSFSAIFLAASMGTATLAGIAHDVQAENNNNRIYQTLESRAGAKIVQDGYKTEDRILVNPCGNDAHCKMRSIETQKYLVENPHLFNVVRGTINGGSSVGDILIEGYKNHKILGHINKGLSGVSFFLPSTAATQAFKAINWFTNSADQNANRRVVYNIDGLNSRDEVQKDLRFAGHPEYGLRNDEFKTKYFPTAQGQKTLDAISFTIVEMENILSASDPTKVNRLKRQLGDKLSLSPKEVDQALQTWQSAKEEFGEEEISTRLAIIDKSYKMHKDLSDRVHKTEQDIKNAKKELETEQSGHKDPEKSEELEKRLAALEKEQETQRKELNAIAQQELENALNLHKDQKALEAAGATANFMGSFMILAGDEEGAAKFTAAAHTMLRAADSLSALSELKSMSSAADVTAAMTAMTGVVGLAIFAMNMASEPQKDPMAELIDALFKNIEAIIDNQILMLEGMDELKDYQLTALYQLQEISQSINSLQKGQLDQTKILMAKLNQGQKNSDQQYFDLSERMEDLADKLGLEKLSDALLNKKNKESANVIKKAREDSKSLWERFSDWWNNAEEKERIKEVEQLREGMIKIQDVIDISEVTDAPALNYKSSLISSPANKDYDGKGPYINGRDHTENLSTYDIDDRQGIIAEIMAPLCQKDAKGCDIFKDIPNADRIKNIMFLYLRAAEILSRDKLGQNVLIADAPKTMEAIGEEIEKIKNSSDAAHNKVAEARKLYADELEKALKLIEEYIVVSVHAMGGKKLGDELLPNDNTSQERGLFYDNDDLERTLLSMSWQDQLDIAELQKIGTYGKNFERLDLQANKGSSSPRRRVIKNYMEIKRPLFINSARAFELVPQTDIDAVEKKGFLRGFLGSSNISSYKVEYRYWHKKRGNFTDKYCGPIRRTSSHYRSCITNIEKNWAHDYENRESVTPTLAHLERAAHKIEKTTTSKLDEDNNFYIRDVITRDIQEGKKLVQRANLEALKQTRDELLMQWERAATGLTPDFSKVKSVVFNPELAAKLDKLPETMQRLSDSRLTYQTALEIAYGQDCLSIVPELKNQQTLLQSGFLAQGSDLAKLPDPGSSSPEKPQTTKTKLLRESYNFLSDESKGLPNKESLIGQCNVGHKGINDLQRLYDEYQAWIAKGAKPVNQAAQP